MKKINKTNGHLFKVILLVAIGLIVSGCSGMNSNFSCSKKPGVMCSSLDQVNTMIDQGQIGGSTTPQNKSLALADMKNFPADLSSSSFNTTSANDPLRHPEKVMRVWIAPFEDDAGNYHQASLMYSVVNKGYWLNHPVTTVNNIP